MPWPTAASERAWRVWLVILCVSIFVLRARYYGDPVIDPDEQFYLLMGDRMLHGAIPYIDIWDRKPVGLFLLYAGIRLLGGDGVIQYQLVASAFCAATALVIATLARRISNRPAALVAAFAYAPALAMNGGEGGQSPVFYNLPIAIGALLIARLIARPVSASALRGAGLAIMTLVGIAVQIKYSAAAEGAFFLLSLAVLQWRSDPRPWRWLATATLWASATIAPTVAAWLYYVAVGQGHAFIFANFTSILRRGAYSNSGHDLAQIGVRLAPFVLVIAMGEWLLAPFRAVDRSAAAAWVHRFVLAWLAAAVAGFVAFGTFFNHYALPLLVPMAVAAAPTFTIRFRQAGAVFAALMMAALYVPYPFDANRIQGQTGAAKVTNDITAFIRPRLGSGCLYVYYGDPILYKTTNSCLPTRWAFPYHLSLKRETPALGIDSVGEVQRIMASRPAVVVDRDVDDDQVDPATKEVVRRWLDRRYRLVGRVKFTHSTTLIWQLRQ